MLEDLNAIQDKVGLLVSWVAEMRALIQNPYSNGLNVPKVLEDLAGYSAELTKQIYVLQERMKKELQPEAESEKAESASVEQ